MPVSAWKSSSGVLRAFGEGVQIVTLTAEPPTITRSLLGLVGQGVDALNGAASRGVRAILIAFRSFKSGGAANHAGG